MILRVTTVAFLLLLASAPAQAADNTLTEQEKKDGWLLLFDGKTTTDWISAKEKPLAASHVQEGALNPHPTDYMLVYDEPLANFVLRLDFKITEKCNSGIFVRTSSLTPRSKRDVGFNGIEVAIQDSAETGYHHTGAIYDLVPTQKNAMKRVAEWNHMQITCDRNIIAVELNGEQVSRMDLDEWTEMNKRPDGSPMKFDVVYKDHPRTGYIGLQDHGSDCWFRNIKLKILD